MQILVHPIGHKRTDTSSARGGMTAVKTVTMHEVVLTKQLRTLSLGRITLKFWGRKKPCLNNFCLLFLLIAHDCSIRSFMSMVSQMERVRCTGFPLIPAPLPAGFLGLDHTCCLLSCKLPCTIISTQPLTQVHSI